MMKRYLSMSLLAAGLCLSTNLLADGQTQWGYFGDEGPAHWGDKDFAMCGKGLNQTPINITNAVEANLPPIVFNYQVAGNEIRNNGHTIRVDYAPGSTITVNGHAFELKQFHFHSPSENSIEGKRFPMEAHLVHGDADDNYAVIALLYEEGAENAELEKVWAHMPQEAGQSGPLPEAVDANALLPQNRDYYRFTGSLTTPPCAEGLMWLVMKTPVTISKAQREQFNTLYQGNTRPLRPLNARLILK
jgi:carbonic anhydrase